MFSIPGAILTVCAVLLSSLVTYLLSKWSPVARVRRASSLASVATPEEKAPQRWESRLRELELEVVSLSSSFEKVTKQLMRLNSRAGMRELREQSSHSEAPPVGAPKADLLKHYGMSGKVGPSFAQAQLELERNSQRSN
jgi:hypothetical protein